MPAERRYLVHFRVVRCQKRRMRRRGCRGNFRRRGGSPRWIGRSATKRHGDGAVRNRTCGEVCLFAACCVDIDEMNGTPGEPRVELYKRTHAVPERSMVMENGLRAGTGPACRCRETEASAGIENSRTSRHVDDINHTSGTLRAVSRAAVVLDRGRTEVAQERGVTRDRHPLVSCCDPRLLHAKEEAQDRGRHQRFRTELPPKRDRARVFRLEEGDVKWPRAFLQRSPSRPSFALTAEPLSLDR